MVWCDGKAPNKVAKLGKPNINYPHKYVTTTNTNDYKYMYRRHQERNFKVVDGDLPSIGWLGELIMRNAAQDGPITWVHMKAQEPLIGANCTVFVGRTSTGTERGWKNQLDIRAKFDLFRPFRPVKKWTPLSSACRTENLQMLDIFTVWDPSNDGMDNDGDGAVDEEDSGCQPGDKCGPEVRVFGRVDLNLAPRRVVATPFPDNPWARPSCDGWGGYCYILNSGRMAQRTEGGTGGNRGFWGPVETLGDLVRADKWSYRPGVLLAGGTNPWINGPVALRESGYVSFYSGLRHSDWSSRKEDPKLWIGDDDGDGIFDERDERDMTFTWIANHFTTRSNVFEIDLIIDLCRRPHYPGGGEGPKLPFRTYKTGIEYARKQVLGILDRSTCLRILPDGRCEFNGPVDVRLLRFSDDKRVY